VVLRGEGRKRDEAVGVVNEVDEVVQLKETVLKFFKQMEEPK
jgi:hypothetical protein